MSKNIVNDESLQRAREGACVQLSDAEGKRHDFKSKDCTSNTYSDEVSIIDNMASFLEANGCTNVDPNVLRNMAEALTKSINDTNPGFLQDATMDNTYGVGYRSPCVSLQQYHGATSPAVQGRSVREFEEHTAALRKENFNLKLRLYFIEENIPALTSNGADGCDTAMRELIEHKVEVEMLRRELEEKKAVLKDALQAIEDLEKIQKETETACEAKVDELKQKIQFLEVDRNTDKSENTDFMNNILRRSDIFTEHVNNIQKIRELEALIKNGEDTIGELENKVIFLDGILSKRDRSIEEFEEKLKSLEFKNAELQEELDEKNKKSASSEAKKRTPKYTTNYYLEKCLSDARKQQETINDLQQLREELREHRIELANKVCLIDELEEKLAQMERRNEQSCRHIQDLSKTIKLQQAEMQRLKSGEKEAKASSSHSILSAVNKKNASSGSSGFSTDYNGHGLNRSFSDTETLGDRDSSKCNLEAKIKIQEHVIESLEAEVKKKTADLQNLVNKELWEKNREIERLTKMINDRNPNSITSPTSKTAPNVSGGELQQSFTEVEYAKAIERNRLLQLKVDILIQRLCAERENELIVTKLRREVREARADAENSDRLCRECAGLCSVLTKRLEELAGFLNSLLKHKDVLGFLAADRRRAMRKAVDRSLDLSKSLNRTLSLSGVSMTEHSLSQLCNLPEILGNVSNISIDIAEVTNAIELGENKTFNSHEEACAIETLKAENKALKKELDKRRTIESKKDRRSLPAAAIAALENQSESEAWSEPDRKVSLARIGLEDHSCSLLVSKDFSVTQICHPDTDSESETDPLNHSRIAKLRAQQQETIAQLEQLVAQRDERILQIQCQLVEADNRLKKENLRVLELAEEVKILRERNDQLNTDLITIGTVAQPNNSTITRDESMWLRQIEEQTQLLENIQEERDRLSIEARVATQQISELKSALEKTRVEHETELKNASKQERQHLQELREILEAEKKQQLEEQQKLHSETLEQLTELQRQYVEAQRSIDSHIENAKELRQTLVESELNARSLKKQLDESALQASQAVMERTKAMNDKLQLEQAFEEYKALLNSTQMECETLKKRIAKLESVKKTTAEKMQATTTTTATTTGDSKDSHLNGSDISQSGYTSEEVAPLLRAKVSTNGKTENACSVQRMNNSSPDLGIESDAGRVSSVELANVHHPLLMKIEIPEGESAKSDGNSDDEKILLESDNKDTENCPPNGHVHDCSKVEQEIADLRRKLTRTKRALEDTYQKLRNSNQKKAQIERDIKNQIIKTHNVLKNVRSNMELEK